VGGWDRDGIEKRMELNVAGVKMIKESPWFGVGLGNFLVRVSSFQKNRGIYWLQPVHNLMILVWSQIGTLGLLLVFWFVEKYIWPQKMNLIFKIMMVIVVVGGMVDHYWLTLPQNVWLLVLVLGII
jgi:O-antigen ligase